MFSFLLLRSGCPCIFRYNIAQTVGFYCFLQESFICISPNNIIRVYIVHNAVNINIIQCNSLIEVSEQLESCSSGIQMYTSYKNNKETCKYIFLCPLYPHQHRIAYAHLFTFVTTFQLPIKQHIKMHGSRQGSKLLLQPGPRKEPLKHLSIWS